MAGAHHIYLIPGFFGFANLGKFKYFGHVRDFLGERCAALGVNARIVVVRTHPTSSLPKRATRVLETVADTLRGRGCVHLIGHSSGGLDARLLAGPHVSLPTNLQVEHLAERIRTVITVATPHHGAPLASFLNSRLDQKVLQVLSLSTIYLLRFGALPVSVLGQLGGVLARLDTLAMNSSLLDQLFGELLADFSPRRRRAVQGLFEEVACDQALLPQLTPESVELFNALVHDRPGVRYASVIARAHSPGIRSALATGLDPSAQATHALYYALYRLATGEPRAHQVELSREQARALRRAYGRLPERSANDGIVPTRSQVWGTVIHAAEADHLDVLGHFKDPQRVPPHFDWLATGSGFTREKFEDLWNAVLQCLLESG